MENNYRTSFIENNLRIVLYKSRFINLSVHFTKQFPHFNACLPLLVSLSLFWCDNLLKTKDVKFFDIFTS